MDNFLKITTNIKDFKWEYTSMLTDEAKDYIVKNLSSQIEEIAKLPILENNEIKEQFHNTLNWYFRDMMNKILQEDEIKILMENKVRKEIKVLLND